MSARMAAHRRVNSFVCEPYWLSTIFDDLMGGTIREVLSNRLLWGLGLGSLEVGWSIRRRRLHYQSHLSIDTCFQASFEGAVGASLGLR